MRRTSRHRIGYGLESVPCVIPRACSTIFWPPIWRPFCFPFANAKRQREIRRLEALSPVYGRLNCKQGCMLGEAAMTESMLAISMATILIVFGTAIRATHLNRDRLIKWFEKHNIR